MIIVSRLDRIVRLSCLFALFGACGTAAIAQAGTYEIKACGDGPQADGWSTWGSPYVAAYPSCPSYGNEGGLVARNSGGAGSAPGYSAGQTVFTAPAGASVVRLRGSVRVNADRGWQAGIRDYTNGNWVFCGPGTCTTFGTYQPLDIGGFAAPQIGGLVICGASSWRLSRSS